MRVVRTLILIGMIAFTLATTVNVDKVHAASCTRIDSPGCTNGLPSEEYAALLAQMNANPAPPVSPIPVASEDVAKYSSYTKSGKPLALASSYTGVLIPGALPFAMGWINNAFRPAPIPGGVTDPTTPKLPRYKPVYIYATLKFRGLDWYLVGPGQWVDRWHVTRLKPATRPADATGRWVAVDLFEQVATAYEGDNLVFATLISSGVRSHQTRVGTFHMWSHFESDDMRGGEGTPNAYSINSVPYVMYFDGDISLHGAFWHDSFGFPMSHGCVNMSISDARWLFNWSMGEPNATVVVWRSR
jgi:lipoprotein-anchoring transpeptidase ErfK/SrfK